MKPKIPTNIPQSNQLVKWQVIEQSSPAMTQRVQAQVPSLPPSTVATAREINEVLEEADVARAVKITGKKGIFNYLTGKMQLSKEQVKDLIELKESK